MQSKLLFRIVLALAVTMSVSTTAEAQLGKLGGAIKKKAKEAAGEKVAEAVVGKDKEPVKTGDAANTAGAAKTNGAPTTATNNAAKSAPAVSAELTIDGDVLTRFARSLDLEVSRRSGYVKRDACTNNLASSPEAMEIVMWMSAEAEKVDKSSMPDEQKGPAVQKLIPVMEQKKTDLEVKRCGPVIEEMLIPQHEKIAAEAGAFSHAQYARLKERVVPYCLARAKGSDTPSDTRLVYTEGEMVAMRPRCTAFLATLKKLS